MCELIVKVLLLYENHEKPQKKISCENIKHLSCLIFSFILLMQIKHAFNRNNELIKRVHFTKHLSRRCTKP